MLLAFQRLLQVQYLSLLCQRQLTHLALVDNQTVALRGYYNQGSTFWFNGTVWEEAQQKLTVNQAPLFDIYDKNGISFGDATVYQGTSFLGNKLFAYGRGTGAMMQC